MSIDEGLYSRQLLVLGAKAMESLNKSRVVLSGLGALGIEVAKNIVLGGVKTFTCHDTSSVTRKDLNFFFEESDVGRNRVRLGVCWTRGSVVHR